MKQYVVGMVFNHTMERTLMLLRKKPPYQDMYNGVGGKIEAGETPSDAMIRELEEETGITVSDISKFNPLTVMTFPNGIELHAFYIILSDINIDTLNGKETDEGMLEWLHINNRSLLDASSSNVAGDGNVAYFLHFARLLEGYKEPVYKHYRIVEESVDSFDCIVYSTCYINPVGELPLLSEDLKGEKKRVLFDLLLCNGNNSNRYLTADFDGEKFDYQSFKEITAEEKTEEIRRLSANYYREHQEFLSASILTSIQKRLVEKGVRLR